MKKQFEVPAELLASPMHEFGSWAQTFLVDVSWYIHRKLMFTERELQHKGIILSHGEDRMQTHAKEHNWATFREEAFQSRKSIGF